MAVKIKVKVDPETINAFNISKEVLALKELGKGPQNYLSLSRLLRLKQGEFLHIRLALEGYKVIQPNSGRGILIVMTPQGERICEAARAFVEGMSRLEFDPRYRGKSDGENFAAPLESEEAPEDKEDTSDVKESLFESKGVNRLPLPELKPEDLEDEFDLIDEEEKDG